MGDSLGNELLKRQSFYRRSSVNLHSTLWINNSALARGYFAQRVQPYNLQNFQEDLRLNRFNPITAVVDERFTAKPLPRKDSGFIGG